MTVKFIFHPEHITVKKKKLRLWGLIRSLSMRWKSRVGEFSWEWKMPMVVPVRETERAD